MERAYSLITFKSVNEEERIIEGVATTPEVDRVGDVVVPTGAEFKLPMPLLWQHQSDQPIGHVLEAKVSSSGIRIRAQIAKHLDLPEIDRAWKLIKSGLVGGLSIGFRPIEMEPINPKEPWGGQRFLRWLWLELSSVTIPANASGTISLVKSLCATQAKGMTPQNVSTQMAPAAESWSGLTLQDFTAQPWGELTETQRRRIAGHFAWAAEMPPATFGDLKLGHHRASDGAVVFAGVVAATGRLNQTSLPSADIAAVKAHLRAHYAQFNQEPPDSLRSVASALSGAGPLIVRSSSPAVVGVRQKGTAMALPISDQLTAVQTELTRKSTRLQELMDLEGADGSLEAVQITERDSLTTEVETLTGRANRLKALEAAQAAQARAVYPRAVDVDVRTVVQPRQAVQVVDNLPKGVEFARAIICRMAALKSGVSALELAKHHYPDHPRIQAFLKEAVPAGSTQDSTWAGPLVYPQNLVSEFIEFLRPQTIIGRIDSFTRVPFNVRIGGQTTGSTGYWVGEGRGKPLTKFDTNASVLTWAKVANISVISDELARFSNPAAETLVRNDLARSCQERLDIDFVDPAKTASANISPASITNGITNLDSSGNTLADVDTDVNLMMSQFALNNLVPTHWILPNTVALALSLMRTSLGARAFPDINMNGGTFMGLPVITSQYCILGTPANNLVVLISAPEIFLADDGGFTVDISREASLEMDDAPTMTAGVLGSPTGATGTAVVSMFQTNSMAIRCERFINWARRRTAGVVWMDDVQWTPSGS